MSNSSKKQKAKAAIQGTMKTKISKFRPTASTPSKAIIMIFDLEGFSKFFSQPDVQEYIPKFINLIMDAIEVNINGGDPYWLKGDKNYQEYKPLPKHIHSKFLGDGGLYIWKFSDFTQESRLVLINRMYNLKLKFKNVVTKASEIIPVLDIPQRIRFGIAAGPVYRLNYLTSNQEEFIGYSINLASRLQSYNRDIGFIVSGRLEIESPHLDKHKYLKVVAKNIKGFPKEIVLIDKGVHDQMSPKLFNDLFERI